MYWQRLYFWHWCGGNKFLRTLLVSSELPHENLEKVIFEYLKKTDTIYFSDDRIEILARVPIPNNETPCEGQRNFQ